MIGNHSCESFDLSVCFVYRASRGSSVTPLRLTANLFRTRHTLEDEAVELQPSEALTEEEGVDMAGEHSASSEDFESPQRRRSKGGRSSLAGTEGKSPAKWPALKVRGMMQCIPCMRP